jgi:hypothetical protein
VQVIACALGISNVFTAAAVTAVVAAIVRCSRLSAAWQRHRTYGRSHKLCVAHTCCDAVYTGHTSVVALVGFKPW